MLIEGYLTYEIFEKNNILNRGFIYEGKLPLRWNYKNLKNKTLKLKNNDLHFELLDFNNLYKSGYLYKINKLTGEVIEKTYISE